MSVFGQSKAGPKPIASLSSTLLARKGTAKPAMRRQGYGGFGSPNGAQDDLGWNDMGADFAPEEAMPAAPPVALVPPVLVQREALHEEFAEPEPEPVHEAAVEPTPAPVPEPIHEPAAETPRPRVSIATAARIGRDASKKHSKRAPKSAFTLRLDEDRHLRLRLASALQNASAQTLVTAALDQFLQSLPEVDDLVRQIPTRASR